MEARRLLEPNIKRFDEQFAAIEWALANNAEAGEKIPHTRLRAIKTWNLYDVNTPIVVYYEIVNDDLVSLHYIERAVEEDS